MSLYLEKCLPYLRKPFTNLPWLHCHPYCWHENFPAVDPAWTTRWHWFFNVCLFTAYFSFVTCRTIQVNLDPFASPVHRFYMAFVNLLYSCAAILYISMVTTRYEFVPFLRGYMKFLQEGGRNATRLVKLCKLLISTLYYTIWGTNIGMAILSIGRPHSPEFLSSLLVHRPEPIRTLCIIASTTFQAYLLMCCSHVIPLICGPINLFMFSMSEFVEMQMDIQQQNDKSGQRKGGYFEKYNCDDKMRRLKGTLKFYRCLQLHTNNFNRLFASFNAMLHGVVIIFVLFCVYGAVRMEGILAVALAYLGFWALITYLLVATSYADIHRRSVNLLRYIRRTMDGRTRRRTERDRIALEIRSMRELRIVGGSAFYFDKTLVLTVVEIILCESVNLLIMY